RSDDTSEPEPALCSIDARAGPRREAPMTRRSMQRRMGTAAALEAFNAGWLALVLFVVAGVPASTANLAGFAVLGALLLEGSAYWTLKRRQLRAGARCPSGLTVLRALR